jgi:hypothetical protein
LTAHGKLSAKGGRRLRIDAIVASVRSAALSLGTALHSACIDGFDGARRA